MHIQPTTITINQTIKLKSSSEFRTKAVFKGHLKENRCDIFLKSEAADNKAKQWVDKATIEDILKYNNIKHTNYTNKINISSPKNLINKNTVVLGNTTIYDKDLKKDIEAIFSLVKVEREYRVVLTDKKNFPKNVLDEDYIAFIKFKVIPKEKLHLFFDGILEKEKTEEILNTETGRNYVTIIGGFANTNAKRYTNAGKKVGLCTIQVLQKFGIENMYFRAFPPSGSNSPIPYYLRGGFELIDCKEDDILKETQNYKTRLIQTKKIAMKMPKNADILKLAQHYNLLKDFI